jgi:hypothetical protein
MHFFGKGDEKEHNKCGGTTKFQPRCKNYAKMNFGSLTSIFGYNFTNFFRNIAFSRGKRLAYPLELLFLHILTKFEKNPRNGFSPSPKNC